MKSRKKNVIKNVTIIIICQFLNTLLGFWNRKVFLSVLGAELLGVNSLFSDVLMLFSFADLGIGTAITFALYKPIAEQDTNKIQSLLGFYRKVYCYVIASLTVISILFLPFLESLQTSIPLCDLTVYYLIFQLDNILGYICAYRETYLIAYQRERDLTMITSCVTMFRVIVQIVSLKYFANFYVYLFLRLFSAIVAKIFINIYVLKYFPETKLKKVEPLSREEETTIFKKAKAMLIQRLGNLAINQTDSLIVSYMIDVTQWGLVSNYLMLKNAIATVTSKIYSSVLPSVGDLMATEGKKKQLETLYMYDLFNAWMCTFCFAALSALSTPFVELNFGLGLEVEYYTVNMLFFSFFMDGMLATITTFREASGAVEKDKWYFIVAAVVNLIASVLFVSTIGLPGVYLGTIIAMLILMVSNSIIFFRNQYNESGIPYLCSLFRKMLLAIAICFVTHWLCESIRAQIGLTLWSFAIITIIVAIVPNALFILAFLRDPYLKKVISFVLKRGDDVC